jgi:hypothetical protein
MASHPWRTRPFGILPHLVMRAADAIHGIG